MFEGGQFLPGFRFDDLCFVCIADMIFVRLLSAVHRVCFSFLFFNSTDFRTVLMPHLYPADFDNASTEDKLLEAISRLNRPTPSRGHAPGTRPAGQVRPRRGTD
jgi:hypothetical protein